MSRKRRNEERAARLTREFASRAARRLDYLEWVILAGAALVAVGGGALVAVLLRDVAAWSFRATWIVSALLLFGVPGILAMKKIRREEREWLERRNQRVQEPDV